MSKRAVWRRVVSAMVLATVMIAAAHVAYADGAKNVILMISDGAGFNTFQAASFYQYGELGRQPYDDFPVKLGCTTYSLRRAAATDDPASEAAGGVSGVPYGYDPVGMWDNFGYARRNGRYTEITDSAAAATALYTGFKTTDGRMATSGDGARPLVTLAQIAHATGRSTGVATTVEVSHATPGAVAAHDPSRQNYAAIFNKMLASKLDVIMGAGHPRFDDNGQPAEMSYKYVGGEATWDDLTDGNGLNGFTFIETKEDFSRLAAGRGPSDGPLPERVVGIAQVHQTLQVNRAGKRMNPADPFNANVPALATMTRGALNVLDQNPKGFLLMIEGGAVDWANHANQLPRMIEEQIDFNNAVTAVVQWIEGHGGWDETLLIVTADHETGMLWGPGAYTDANGNGRFDPGTDTFNRWDPIENHGAGKLPGVRYGSGGHTNTLVPLWANGPGSESLLDLVDGIDAKAGRLWGFSGKYVDNTDVFTAINAALLERAVTESIPSAPVSAVPAAAQ